MNVYLKRFLRRGLMFGGFGPIVAGVVYYALSLSIAEFSLTGAQVLLAIVSTYALAFVQAGVSVFNQIEHWPVYKSLLCHFLVLYLAYVFCYLLNTWIPFEPMVLLIFTLIFVAFYFVIWITVYLCLKSVSKKMNTKIQ